ncbi:MAG: glycosyltransferase family 39 protein [Bacteroidetes bacterium]|nr:glycosyltransferase family 39 protein [Bacteroidota bacterium]
MQKKFNISLLNTAIENKSYSKILWSIISLSFLIKILLTFFLPSEIRSDSYVYHSLAQSIVNTFTYSFEGKLTGVIAPGYSIFLSGLYFIFGPEQFYVKIIQSILEIFTCYLFFKVCLNYFDAKKSLIALSIFAFFPSNILFSQTILTEPLFGFLAILILFLVLKDNFVKYIFVIGLLWGYAILIRSSFAPSILLIPLFLFFYKRKEINFSGVLKYSLLFFIGAFLVICPWLIRNKTTLNTFTIATQGGFTFWSGSNPDATGTWYHKIEESNPLFNIEDEAQRDKEFYKLGIDYALHNPHKFLVTGIKKLGYLFSSERMIVLYFTKGDGKESTSTQVYKSVNPLLIALINIPYFVVMSLGLWGLLMMKRKTFFIWGMIFSWLFTFFMFVALARYHYVLVPFFIIGTVYFIYHYKTDFSGIAKWKKATAVLFNLFLLGVWGAEFYLLYFK